MSVSSSIQHEASFPHLPPDNGTVDEAEAREIARSIIGTLRDKTYETLVDRYLDAHAHRDVVGASGVEYQVEIDAYWDSGEPGDLRVIVAIDDGGWRAFSPLVEDFIIARDGSLVGDEG